MKYSANFERDYEFYLKNLEKFNFAPYQPPEIKLSPEGKDAKYCFWKLDSTGSLQATNEPEILRSLIVCKKSVNFHLKMWLEGFEDMGMTIDEYLAEFISPPEWVKVSFEKLLFKRKLMLTALAAVAGVSTPELLD